MRRARKWLLAALALVMAIVITLIFAGASMQRSFFYPKPDGLPPVTSQSAEELLRRLETLLQMNAPIVLDALQPGLSEAQIEALELQGGVRLSEDFRILYRWHNGMSTNSAVGLLAGQRFVPLEEAIATRASVARKVETAPGLQRAAFAVFARHRKDWLQVLDDGADDGYFYDPKRKDEEGAFFHHVAEAGYYLWFPSVRNFLAAVVECYESQAIKVAADGKSLDEDFERTEKIWKRFSKSSESDG